MVLVMMSARELQRVEVLAEVAGEHMAAAVAAGHLGVGRRQLFRLLARFRAEGAAGLASRRRGRPSNRRTPEAVRAQALALVRERYADFGPTLAAEKLLALHGLKVGRETLRGWMAAAGLWASRKAHLARVHQPRPRRDRLGELVQVDGCEHPWLEGRGPPCSLLVFVDDATGRLMHLKLVPAESALAYMQATRDYVAAYGKPVAFYSDRHGIFRVNREARRGDGMTQFGRALRDLDIQILCAPSPQAKGRVERAHLTLQDRLVKELRLAGVATVEAANRFLPGFVADYNKRFAKPPRCPEDAHRRLAPYESLDEALAWREDTHRVGRADAELQPHAADPGPWPPGGAGGGGPAGDGVRLPRRPAGGALEGRGAALPAVRQAAKGRAGRRGRQQAPGGSPGLRPRGAGQGPCPPAARPQPVAAGAGAGAVQRVRARARGALRGSGGSAPRPPAPVGDTSIRHGPVTFLSCADKPRGEVGQI